MIQPDAPARGLAGLLLAPFRAFWDFWTVPIRAESLALFRILLGVTIILCQLTGFGLKLGHTCGEDGVCPPEACDEWLDRTSHFCVMRGPHGIPFLSDWLPDELAEDFGSYSKWVSDDQARDWKAWGAKPKTVYQLFGVYLVALVLMTAGFCTRLSTLAALILAGSFNARLSWLINGGDSLFRNGLYFLLLSPAGATWSIDHWLRRRRERRWAERQGQPVEDKPVFIAPWSVRLMQIQVCMIYLFTGLSKTTDDPIFLGLIGQTPDPDSTYPYRGDYLDGGALYWVLNDITICRWSYAMVPIPFFICRLMSWMTLIFEIGFSFFVLIKPLRPYLLLLGLGMHVGILAIMEIGWFSQVMMCWYILFVPGEQVSAFFGRLARRFRKDSVEG